MNTTISPYVTAQRFSVIRDMAARAAAYDNAIPLSIGEPDFHTPTFVCEAAMKDALRGHTHYAPSNGDADLRAAVLEAERAKHGLPWEGKHLLITTGAMGAGFLGGAVAVAAFIVIISALIRRADRSLAKERAAHAK